MSDLLGYPSSRPVHRPAEAQLQERAALSAAPLLRLCGAVPGRQRQGDDAPRADPVVHTLIAWK